VVEVLTHREPRSAKDSLMYLSPLRGFVPRDDPFPRHHGRGYILSARRALGTAFGYILRPYGLGTAFGNSLRHALPPLPGAQQLPQQHDLPDVIGIVIRDEQRFAKNVLAGAVRNFGV
jgi:hypothetical protein